MMTIIATLSPTACMLLMVTVVVSASPASLLTASAGSDPGAVPVPVKVKETGKRFLVPDGVLDVLHALVDPVAAVLTDTAYTLATEFGHLVHGHVDIHTVVCKLREVNGTRDDNVEACVNECVVHADDILGTASDTAFQSCPVVCQYAFDHPSQYSC